MGYTEDLPRVLAFSPWLWMCCPAVDDGEGGGVKISRTKTVCMRFNGDGNSDGNLDINLQVEILERVITFQYISTTLAENGDTDAKMTHIGVQYNQDGKLEYCRGISGVLCRPTRRISLRVKGKLQTVVRPAMMNCAETYYILKKSQETILDVAERQMTGVTKMDRIRNEIIRGTAKVRKK